MADSGVEPPPASIPGKAARNARRKLLAAWVNNLAGATITVGNLAPVAGILYGFSAIGPDRSAGGADSLGTGLAGWRIDLTSDRAVDRRKDRGITWEQLYALFGAPFVLVGLALVMVGITRWFERRERRALDGARSLRR